MEGPPSEMDNRKKMPDYTSDITITTLFSGSSLTANLIIQSWTPLILQSMFIWHRRRKGPFSVQYCTSYHCGTSDSL